MSKITIKNIENKIYVIRGQNVMLDSDLADLYEIPTKRLNEQVKRNIERFPSDFIFHLTKEESEILRSQIATSRSYGGRRYAPYVFTENGVAMLSSVLKSPKAIQVNIAIMRIFTKLRSFLLLEKDLSQKVDKLERGTNHLFKIVFERLDNIEEIIIPKLSPKRKKIGLKK